MVSVTYFTQGTKDDEFTHKDNSEKRTAQALSIYKAVGAIGYVLGSLVAPLLLSILGYRGTLLIYAFMFITALIVSIRILPS